MAEKIVSPGVFTNEKDLSFLPAGVAGIGAAIIGPTVKGPAFVPTIIRNFEEFKTLFGGLSEETYVPYAVMSYLKAASTVTVVRVLSEGGYKTDTFVIAITGSGATSGRVIGIVAATTALNTSTNRSYDKTLITNLTNASYSGSLSQSFNITLSGSGVNQAITASFVPSATNYVGNVLGTSVKGVKQGHMYTLFGDYLTSVNTAAGVTMSFYSASADCLLDLSGSNLPQGEYQPAATPWIVSQTIGGERLQLFKLYTLADGTDTNTSVKVSVVNNVLPGDDPGSDYGSFTIVVRDYNDTDQRPTILETFNSLNLDPDSVNYIARRIGDRAYTVNSEGLVTITGDYRNVSKYIRVEASAAVKEKAITTQAKPFGFEALLQPFKFAGALVNASFPAYSVVNNGAGGVFTEIGGFYNKKSYYGWNFAKADNSNWLKPLPNGAVKSGSDAGFNLDDCFVHPSASKGASASTWTGGVSISGSTFAGLDVANVLKFTVPFQGGFDGMDPAIPKKVGSNITATNLFGMDCSTTTAGGTLGYVKALNVLTNADEYDVNLIVTPGATVQYHAPVVNKAIEVAEDRGDAFVIVDPVIQGQTIDTTIATVQDGNLDTSYAAVYWPWVKVTDTDRNKPIWVPPSVVLPRVIAQSDTAAFEWFAPAGLNRGGIADAVDAELKLNQAQRNDLYEARINAIATFPNQGICVWGQKTLQAKPSALDRVNVRRLMISLKKFIASASRYLVFENNTTATRQRFINIVTPYLETVKARQGLYAFRVVMDETNNTPDIIDQNIMYGQIYLQPAKAAEFIILDFNILPTGATFENA